MALKMLLGFGDDAPPLLQSVLRAMHTITPHKKHIRLLGGLSPINPTRRRARLALEWDSRGPLSPAAVKVGLVVVCSVQPLRC